MKYERGLSIALAVAQVAFSRAARARRSRAAFALGCASFTGLLLTMALACWNELSMLALPQVGGVRAMVSLHGTLNAIVVAPCFLLAVAIDAPRRAERWAQGGASGSRMG